MKRASSRLFNIEPIGIGTPYVESLTSYIKRLAKSHSVLPNVLLEKEVFPEIFHYGNRMGCLNSSVKTSLSLNYLNEIIRVLEIKTSNCNIKNISLSKFGTRIYSQFVFRKYAAWCPICYEERKQLNTIIYEPLIWSIQNVSVCKKHHVKLRFSCPNCNSQIKRYSAGSEIGYCYYCKSWLGTDHTDKTNDFCVLAHDQIGKVLCKLPSFDHSNYSDTWEINSLFKYLKKIDELISLEEKLKARKADIDEMYRRTAELNAARKQKLYPSLPVNIRDNKE